MIHVQQFGDRQYFYAALSHLSTRRFATAPPCIYTCTYTNTYTCMYVCIYIYIYIYDNNTNNTTPALAGQATARSGASTGTRSRSARTRPALLYYYHYSLLLLLLPASPPVAACHDAPCRMLRRSCSTHRTRRVRDERGAPCRYVTASHRVSHHCHRCLCRRRHQSVIASLSLESAFRVPAKERIVKTLLDGSVADLHNRTLAHPRHLLD